MGYSIFVSLMMKDSTHFWKGALANCMQACLLKEMATRPEAFQRFSGQNPSLDPTTQRSVGVYMLTLLQKTTGG